MLDLKLDGLSMPTLDIMLTAVLDKNVEVDAQEQLPVVVVPDGTESIATIVARLRSCLRDPHAVDGAIFGSVSARDLQSLARISGIKTIRMQQVQRAF